MHERYLDQHNVTLIRVVAHWVRRGCGGWGYPLRRVAHSHRDRLNPRLPRFDGANHVATSDALWELQERPEHAVIIGGGYIAVEYASLLAGLGRKSRSLYVHKCSEASTPASRPGVRRISSNAGSLFRRATIESVSESKPRASTFHSARG